MKLTATQSKASAVRLVQLINTAAKTFVGSVETPHGTLSAEMTKEEIAEIAEPLASMAQRHAGAVDAVSKFADPLALVIAASVWAMRVFLIYRLKGQIAQAQAEMARANPHAPDIQTIRDMPTPPQPGQPDPNERTTVVDLQSRMSMGG